MRRIHWLGNGIAGAMIGLVTAAYGTDFAKPDLALHQVVEAMPTGQRQDVRVLTATFKPGDRTVTPPHPNRFGVTVYVLWGAFLRGSSGAWSRSSSKQARRSRSRRWSK